MEFSCLLEKGETNPKLYSLLCNEKLENNNLFKNQNQNMYRIGKQKLIKKFLIVFTIYIFRAALFAQLGTCKN